MEPDLWHDTLEPPDVLVASLDELCDWSVTLTCRSAVLRVAAPTLAPRSGHLALGVDLVSELHPLCLAPASLAACVVGDPSVLAHPHLLDDLAAAVAPGGHLVVVAPSVDHPVCAVSCASPALAAELLDAHELLESVQVRQGPPTVVDTRDALVRWLSPLGWAARFSSQVVDVPVRAGWFLASAQRR